MKWLFWASSPQKDPEDDSHPNNGRSPDKKPKDALKSEPIPGNTSNPTETTLSKIQSSKDWNLILDATDWRQFLEPKTVIPTLLLTSGVLFCVHIHRKYLRRIQEAGNISPKAFRRRSIYGKVTSVGDGDNFRMYHTPGGILGGWGWLRKVPTGKNELRNRTIHVRIAGVDAPELPHFGRPAQPFSHEAHAWLTKYLINRHVRAYIHRPDQYGRVVGTVYVRRWLLFRRDVGLQMLKNGWATIYEAKTGAEFGGAELEKKYRRAEELAKHRGRGLWQGLKGKKKAEWESPRAYKTRMAAEEGQGKDNGESMKK